MKKVIQLIALAAIVMFLLYVNVFWPLLNLVPVPPLDGGQIVREGLHNVRKHAQAKNVTVGVGRDGDVFELSMEDNGKGFPFAGAYSLEELELLRRGPVTIRTRVRNLRGEMLLDSDPGRRSALRIRIPL